MLLLKLAFKNIYGAGIRTWLNVIALSFAYVAIITIQGLISGMTHQMEQASIKAQYGGGQYWQKVYDPFDVLTLDDAHSTIPPELNKLIEEKKALPILIRQATIYPQGRMQNTLLKGIKIEQNILTIPTHLFSGNEDFIPGLIGSRMAKSSGLNKGDYVTVRWRDSEGTYDANEIKIIEIMKTDALEIDDGQIWIPLEQMRKMTSMRNEATKIVLENGSQFNNNISGWEYKSLDFLLQDVHAAMEVEAIGDSLFYIVLLILAMLSIFDTQVLSIFRRRKEMGTLMALGMTRKDLITLFTIEGSMYAVLAAIIAFIYGTPLFIYLSTAGISLQGMGDSIGFNMGDTLSPNFSAGLIITTVLIVFTLTTFVSYLPTRKIAKLKPTDALRGKLI